MPPAPLLVIGVGNPARGDDALGPRFVERLSAELAAELARGELEVLTDFQLQLEHALDLAGRRQVVFVDASVSAAPPFEYACVEPQRSASASSHALAPAAVLEAYRKGIGGEPPAAWVLAIRGLRFELGQELSTEASGHLEAALQFFLTRAGAPARAGQRLELEGVVQGVGLRPWVHRTAKALGLTGAVHNTRRGVAIEAYGSDDALAELLRALQQRAPAAAHLRAVRVTPLPPAMPDASDFVIAPSEDGAGQRAALGLPPDLATCDACLRDVEAPARRYHRYAFTSCTECGPRLAIARTLPFDRSATTMAAFELCAACAEEYGDPSARRFHAQTLACPRCGPRLTLAGLDGVPQATDDALGAAAALLAAGKLVGVQGPGAFHLVCDATNADVVAELRRRKRRLAQPFAVMVRDLAAAEQVAELDEPLRRALTSPARPIVLAPMRTPSPLVAEVSGVSRRVGVMLPYSALHHLLVAAAARPLVVTSGNPRGGPAVIDHAEARAVLPPLADALLLHDRPIARRVEDSVIAQAPAAPGGVRVVRRSRGLAPLPVRLPASAPEPVLAVGGHHKNTACLVVDDLAFLTPHLGDLDHLESERAWRREVEGLEQLFGLRAEVLAHDLHPEYATTRYALGRSARRRIGVQHHVAHVLAAVAELQLDEPVLGIVFDGTGFGTDGTAWGGELLLVEGARWHRVATLRPLPLPGGERAIREVWRVALGALTEAFGGEETPALTARLDAFASVSPDALAGALRMIATDTAIVRARGLGRWFDALGALALGLGHADFDGHVPLALEEAALGEGRAAAYPVAIERRSDAPLELDLRPTVRAAVADLLGGASAATLSARFHAAVIEATSAVAAQVLAERGLRHVVLSGGSMQNRALERGFRERLAGRIQMARDVPVNDGGLALGQAWAAVLALTDEGA